MKAARILSLVCLAAVLGGALVVTGCASGQSTTLPPTTSQTTVQPTGAGTSQTGGASAMQATAPATTGGQTGTSTAGSAQVLPVPQDPIVNTSTKPGLQIVSAMAENNVDPVTKKDIADRLQITIKNTSGETLSNLEVYYEMKDVSTNKTEGYYQQLTGFALAPGAEGTAYFDNQTGTGHYPENKFSLYRTSQNEVDFTIEVSSPGYAPAVGQAVKAVGTGENPGD